MSLLASARSFSAAADKKENSESGQNEIKSTVNATLRGDQPSTELGTFTLVESNVVADATEQDQTCISTQQDISVMRAAHSLMQTATHRALMPDEVQSEETPDVFKSKVQQESQQLTTTRPETNLKHDTGNANHRHTSGQRTFSLKPIISDSLYSLITRQEKTEQLQKDTTSHVIDSEPTTPNNYPTSSEYLAAGSETNDAQEPEKNYGDTTVAPKNVVTIVMNMEPQDVQKNKGVGSDVLRCSQEAGSFNADLPGGSSLNHDEKKAQVHSTSINPASDKKKMKNILETVADVPEKDCDTSVKPKSVYTIVLELKTQDAQEERENAGASTSYLIRSSERAELLNEKVTESYTEDSENRKLMLLSSSKSRHTVSECQPPGANAAETTFPRVKRDEAAGCCHHDEQTTGSVSSAAEDSVRTGNVLTEAQVSAGDTKQNMAVNSAQSTGAGDAEAAGESREECPELQHSEGPESRSALPSLQADAVVSRRRVRGCIFCFLTITILHYAV